MSEFENQNESFEEVVETVENTETAETVEESYNDASTAAAPEEKQSNVFAIISMIAGIISLVCCCLGMVSIIIAIAAVVLGIISIKKEEPKKGMAIAGIICGGVGLIISVVLVAAGTAIAEAIMANAPADVQQQYQQILEQYQ